MNSLLFHLKGQVTILNLLLVFLIVAAIFYRFQKRRTAKIIFVSTLIIFLLFSTYYLPHYLAQKLEKKYPPLSSTAIKNIKGKVIIHVLGSGYSPNKNFPPNAQIGLIALGRLAEAIRVYRLLDSAVIVCSGNSLVHDIETQAQVTRDAALVLGIPAEHLETLNTPSTTQEEAKALLDQYGKDARVIIATDASHMPRAINFFKAVGFSGLIAAPTNFKVIEAVESNKLKWWPSTNNINLSNVLLHELLGNIKVAL